MRRGHAALFVAFVLGLFALGCGNGNHLALAPVQCLVTLDGKPLGGAKVVFTPEAGRIARGETRDDGLATLSTYGNGDGAIVGKHVVVVFGPNAPKQDGRFNPDLPVAASIVPLVYSNPATSGLNCGVKPGQKNLVKLELTSKSVPSNR